MGPAFGEFLARKSAFPIGRPAKLCELSFDEFPREPDSRPNAARTSQALKPGQENDVPAV
jgi:hypothetical protein